jgi:hypothetical protein
MSDSIIINQPIRQTTVVIDTDTNNIYPISNFIKQLSSNFQTFLNVSNNVISNSSSYLNLSQEIQLTVLQNLSSKWIETADEMDTIIQPLTSKLIETGIEMDTLQISNTGNWQDVYEYVEKGVVDGGFF